MAFPAIPTSAGGRILSSANTNPAGTHTFPSLTGLTKNAGDLLIAIVITYDGNSANAEFSGWGGGFTEFVDQATTTTMGIGCAYKWSTGSETGAFTVASADTSANDSQCILLSISDAHPSTAPEGGAIANGTAAAANIAALNPAGWGTEDTLWIAVCGSGEDGTSGAFTAPSAAPANYGSLFATTVSADVVGGVYGAVAFRQLNGASDDPATFTVDTSNARNSALLLAVRPKEIFDLAVDAGTHAHAADNLALTQVHALTLADASQAHTAGNLDLTQVHVLTVQNGVHAHAADNLVLVEVPTLVVASALHAHSADNIDLQEQSGATDLVIADAAHAHAADSLTLTQVHNLTVDGAAQSHAADNVTLTQVHSLQIDAAAQSQAAGNLALTQVHELAVQDAAQGHTADECQVNSATQLDVANTAHDHSADNLALTQVHELVVADALQGHTATAADLTQVHELAIADTTHAQAAANLDLSSSDEIDLLIASALHQHAASNLKLYTHLRPPPAVLTAAAAAVHAAGVDTTSFVPGVRPRVTQRSGVA